MSWTTEMRSDCVSNEYKFIECLRDNLLLQHVMEPTRSRGTDTPHLLDLIISNGDFVDNLKYLSPLGKSDHSVLQFDCKVYYSLQFPNVNKRNYHKGDYNGLRKFMNRNWVGELSSVSTDIESMWSHFKSILNEGINTFIPLNKGTSQNTKPSWKYPVTPELKKIIRKKHRLWTRFQETKNLSVWTNYKLVSNIVRRESRKAIQIEQRIVAQSVKKNPKKFWKYVKSKTTSVIGVGNIKQTSADGEDTWLMYDQDKSNAFAEYFSKVYTIESTDEYRPLPPIQDKMPIYKFTINDVYQKLSKLKIDKSPGPDMFHPRVLQEISSQIAEAFKLMYDLSLNNGKLPEDWISSNVSVIYKKGSRADVSNYRPISLTCIACKVLESLLRDHIMSFFVTNNLFTPRQFGFIKGRSTVLQQLQLMDIWTKALENGGQIDIVYTDFEKAFDKVPHKRLLSKLISYGFNDQIIKWIEGFLCHRKHQVNIKGKCSKWMTIPSGIPQGSVLGPLLFVIYINDLPDTCTNLGDLFLFADDAKIYKYIQTKNDCNCLMDCCQNVYEWCKVWLMKLNIKKCKVLTIAVSNNLIDHTYGFNTEQSGLVTLERVQSMKDLGVTFDVALSFKEHIYEKINKAYQMIGIVNRNFHNLDKITFLQLYKCLIRSHLEYANSVWNPYKKYLVHDIEKVQKRATKLVKSICKMKYNERLVYLQLPTLKIRRDRGDMIEVYKILNNHYDVHTIPNISRSENVRTRGNSFKLQNERTKYDLRKYSFTVRIINLWNSLPEHVVNAKSVNNFKNNIDKLWMKEELYFNFEANWSWCHW
jgi:hypothetical protein